MWGSLTLAQLQKIVSQICILQFLINFMICACRTRVVYSMCRYLYKRSSHLEYIRIGGESITLCSSKYTRKTVSQFWIQCNARISNDTFFSFWVDKLTVPIVKMHVPQVVFMSLYSSFCPRYLAAPGGERVGG